MSAPLVSIIVRSFNEEKHIRRLLEGLFSQRLKDHEVVIVDSGSTDRTPVIASEYPVKLIHLTPEEFSFGYALNCGARHSGGEFLVFISAHCYPTSTVWLDCLMEMFEDSAVGAVYGRQRGNELTRFFEHRIFEKLFPETSIPRTSLPFCNNANIAVRKALWDQIPYDEELTGLEDLDWARKAVAKGYHIAYSAQAEVVHVHEESSVQRFNRYKREAIALRSIFPESRFNWVDLLWLYTSHCLLDSVAALKRGLLKDKFREIVRDRWDQFAGTFSGYRFKGPLAKEMKMQFFYPGLLSGDPGGSHVTRLEPDPPFKRKHGAPTIVALVPMRADSKRVPNKNIRLFNGKPLYYYILNSLLGCPHIKEVFVNTNSPLLMEEIPRIFGRVRIIPRPEGLCADTVPMNDILLHDVEYAKADWYFQTHATNPLLRTETITRAVETFLESDGYDSLFAVTPIYARLWDLSGRPMNHDKNVLFRTQDLEPVFEENSNVYIFGAESLKRLRNRIGDRPLMFEIPREEAWDIDEELDFRIAEFLYAQRRQVERSYAKTAPTI